MMKFLSELLVLDIETVPVVPAFTDMDTDWQELYLSKVTKTMPEALNVEELYRKKAGILAEFGKIVCISMGFFYTDSQLGQCFKIRSIDEKDEVEILRIFTHFCEKMKKSQPGFQFAGHNIREFDIPYICRRMLINGLPLPDCLKWHDKKPWEVQVLDTLSWWKFGDYKNYISLHLLAKVLQVPGVKTDMDGSWVQDVYYKDNNLPRIVKYCEEDVRVTADIILRFHQLPLLEKQQVMVVTGS